MSDDPTPPAQSNNRWQLESERARLLGQVREIDEKRSWSAFLAEHLGTAWGIIMVLGGFVAIAAFPVIAFANAVTGRETGPAIGIALIVGFGVWIVWNAAQEKLKVDIRHEELLRRVGEIDRELDDQAF